MVVGMGNDGIERGRERERESGKLGERWEVKVKKGGG